MKKLLALSGLAFLFGCSSPPPPPAVIPTPTPQPVPVAPLKPAIDYTDKYWNGISAGGGAASFAQSASSPDDWRVVEHKYQNAVNALKSVPPDSPHYKDAQSYLKRFQLNVADAQKMVAGKLTTPPASLLDNNVPEPPRRPGSFPKSPSMPVPTPVTTPEPTVEPSPTPAESSTMKRKRYYPPRPVTRPTRGSGKRR